MDNPKYPSMNWTMPDLDREFKRFRQHCSFTFGGPLSGKTELEKVNYLMTYIGDKGREIYNTLEWAPAVPATEDTDAVPAENHTVEGVFKKFATYVAPKRNQIRATVSFNRRKQEAQEKFDNFVTDLKILVKDCGYTDENRMVRDAIVLRSHNSKVQEKCLEKGDELTLDLAVHVGQSCEMSLESMRVIASDEDPKVTVNKITRARGKPTGQVTSKKE